MKDGYLNRCKECKKEANRKWFNAHKEERKEYDYHRQRHSPQRLFTHKYATLRSRCTKAHATQGIKKSVFGKKFLSKEKWLEWCYEPKNYKAFLKVYSKWVESNFERKLSPSIDRIDNKKGYVIGNLQWLPLYLNCKKYNK